MKNNRKIVLVFSLFFMNNSIIECRYQSAPLQRIATKNRSFMTDAKDQAMSLKFKVFSPADCKKHFNTKSILKKGYQPVQIAFTNNSNQSVTISLDNFSFQCTPAEEVAYSLHRDGFNRGIGFGFGSLWFFPLIIPAFVQGFGAHEYNEDMDIDFIRKSLKEQIVAPNTTVEGVIFASRNEFSKDFTLIVETVNKKQTFTIHSI